MKGDRFWWKKGCLHTCPLRFEATVQKVVICQTSLVLRARVVAGLSDSKIRGAIIFGYEIGPVKLLFGEGACVVKGTSFVLMVVEFGGGSRFGGGNLGHVKGLDWYTYVDAKVT